MNNEYDWVDNFLFDNFNKNNKIPYNVEQTIKYAMHKNSNKINIIANIKKIIISIIGLLTITGGIVFANDISKVIKYFFPHNDGMETAIENGYIEEPKMEYIESNGTKIKVNKMIMDDFNLSLNFSIELDNDKIDVDKIQRVRFPDMLIYDEDNRIIYCENINSFEKFCTENNLNYKYDEDNENIINNGSNWYVKSKSNEDNTIELIYNLISDKYPKSKKLNIRIGEIYLSENEISENEEIGINGEWNLLVDIPKEMYEREAIVYNVKSCSDSDIKVTEAVLYNTCMKFEFTTNVQPIYDDSDSPEVQDRKIDELAEWYKNQRLKYDKSYINNELLVSLNGKKYLPAESSSEDAGTEYLVDGTFRHWQTFTLTKYEMPDTMKIYFNINIPSGSKDVIIELERK